VRSSLFLFASLAALLAACGSTTLIGTGGHDPGDGGPGDGGPGGGVGPGDGGCLEPTEGASCTTAETACQPPGDPCCLGYVWSCVSGTWQKLGLGCACQPPPTPFACGNTTCSGDQYCQDHPPGIPPPPDAGPLGDTYVCVSLPASCSPVAYCGCVQASIPAPDPCSSANPGVTCDDDGQGHVTVHCLGI
jgi:hypothetical protein